MAMFFEQAINVRIGDRVICHTWGNETFRVSSIPHVVNRGFNGWKEASFLAVCESNPNTLRAFTVQTFIPNQEIS